MRRTNRRLTDRWQSSHQFGPDALAATAGKPLDERSALAGGGTFAARQPVWLSAPAIDGLVWARTPDPTFRDRLRGAARLYPGGASRRVRPHQSDLQN